MFYIIEKVTAINSDLFYTPIGYVESLEDANYISNYETLKSWIDTNKDALISASLTIQGWIETNPAIYKSGNTTLVLGEDSGLPLITDLNNPEGI